MPLVPAVGVGLIALVRVHPAGQFKEWLINQCCGGLRPSPLQEHFKQMAFCKRGEDVRHHMSCLLSPSALVDCIYTCPIHNPAPLIVVLTIMTGLYWSIVADSRACDTPFHLLACRLDQAFIFIVSVLIAFGLSWYVYSSWIGIAINTGVAAAVAVLGVREVRSLQPHFQRHRYVHLVVACCCGFLGVSYNRGGKVGLACCLVCAEPWVGSQRKACYVTWGCCYKHLTPVVRGSKR